MSIVCLEVIYQLLSLSLGIQSCIAGLSMLLESMNKLGVYTGQFWGLGEQHGSLFGVVS